MCTYCLKQDGSVPTYEEWLDMMETLEQLAQEDLDKDSEYSDADDFYSYENYW